MTTLRFERRKLRIFEPTPLDSANSAFFRKTPHFRSSISADRVVTNQQSDELICSETYRKPFPVAVCACLRSNVFEITDIFFKTDVISPAK